MIEFANSKKMIILVMILIVACIYMMILEGMMTDTNGTKPVFQNKFAKVDKFEVDKKKEKKIEKHLTNKTKEANSEKLENTFMCWLNEDHLIKEPCGPCTEFEKKSNQPACSNTGYKELVKCKHSGEVFRSCFILNDSQSFWSFQFTTIIFSIIGTILINLRKKKLDQKMLERLRRQLHSGV